MSQQWVATPSPAKLHGAIRELWFALASDGYSWQLHHPPAAKNMLLKKGARRGSSHSRNNPIQTLPDVENCRVLVPGGTVFVSWRACVTRKMTKTANSTKKTPFFGAACKKPQRDSGSTPRRTPRSHPNAKDYLPQERFKKKKKRRFASGSPQKPSLTPPQASIPPRGGSLHRSPPAPRGCPRVTGQPPPPPCPATPYLPWRTTTGRRPWRCPQLLTATPRHATARAAPRQPPPPQGGTPPPQRASRRRASPPPPLPHSGAAASSASP